MKSEILDKEKLDLVDSLIRKTPGTDKNFSIWILVRISAVLFSVKSGELIKLDRIVFKKLSVRQKILIIQNICFCLGLKYYVVYKNDFISNIIVYDPILLRESISKIPVIFRDALCFKSAISGTEILSCLRKTWNKDGLDKIPNEIGFLLGYPPKDVLGFMGLIDLPKNKNNKFWVFFGDPNLSIKISSSYAVARERFLEHLGLSESGYINLLSAQMF